MFLCKRCNNETKRKSGVQKYCLGCSNLADIERKKKYRENSKPKTPRSQQSLKSLSESNRLESRGHSVNDDSKRKITWMGDSLPDFLRVVRVSVPFSWSFSKNAIFSMSTQRGHVYIRKNARLVRDHLTIVLKKAVSEMPFFRGKVWLDILVQKPSNKGDAVNVVDSVCDAVKVAIGIDDRYFSIRRLDWEIVKENPKIFVGVAQEITEHHFVCTYCGKLWPESHKASHRSTCRHCRFDSHPVGGKQGEFKI